MPKIVKKPQFNLIQSIRDYFKITPYSPIMDWIKNNITLVDDVSSERDKPDFDLYKYQVDILKQWEDFNVRKHVTVVACEQTRLSEKLQHLFMEYFIV